MKRIFLALIVLLTACNRQPDGISQITMLYTNGKIETDSQVSCEDFEKDLAGNTNRKTIGNTEILEKFKTQLAILKPDTANRQPDVRVKIMVDFNDGTKKTLYTNDGSVGVYNGKTVSLDHSFKAFIDSLKR